jgi:hypothetical protein
VRLRFSDAIKVHTGFAELNGYCEDGHFGEGRNYFFEVARVREGCFDYAAGD